MDWRVDAQNAAADYVDIRRELTDAAALFRATPGLIPMRRPGQFTIPVLCGSDPTRELQKHVMLRWQRVEDLVEEWRWCDYVHARSPHTIRLLKYKDDQVALAPREYWCPAKVSWKGKEGEDEVASLLQRAESQPRRDELPEEVWLVKSLREAGAQADVARAYIIDETN